MHAKRWSLSDAAIICFEYLNCQMTAKRRRRDSPAFIFYFAHHPLPMRRLSVLPHSTRWTIVARRARGCPIYMVYHSGNVWPWLSYRNIPFEYIYNKFQSRFQSDWMRCSGCNITVFSVTFISWLPLITLNFYFPFIQLASISSSSFPPFLFVAIESAQSHQRISKHADARDGNFPNQMFVDEFSFWNRPYVLVACGMWHVAQCTSRLTDAWQCSPGLCPRAVTCSLHSLPMCVCVSNSDGNNIQIQMRPIVIDLLLLLS